jgi:hypothetical protein
VLSSFLRILLKEGIDYLGKTLCQDSLYMTSKGAVTVLMTSGLRRKVKHSLFSILEFGRYYDSYCQEGFGILHDYVNMMLQKQ